MLDTEYTTVQRQQTDGRIDRNRLERFQTNLENFHTKIDETPASLWQSLLKIPAHSGFKNQLKTCFPAQDYPLILVSSSVSEILFPIMPWAHVHAHTHTQNHQNSSSMFALRLWFWAAFPSENNQTNKKTQFDVIIYFNNITSLVYDQIKKWLWLCFTSVNIITVKDIILNKQLCLQRKKHQ